MYETTALVQLPTMCALSTAGNNYISMEVQGLTAAFTDDYINPSVLEAQLKAYQVINS